MSFGITSSGNHTNVSNPLQILYVKGDANTDGSIRIVFTEGETESHIESRASGVWNDTDFRFAAGSIKIGRDLTINASAGFIETRNPSGIIGHVRSIVPHIQFDDDGTKQINTPVLDEEKDFVVFGGVVSETIATTIGINLGESPGRFIEKSIHEVGSVGATSQITINIYDGTDNTGFLISRRVLPASDMPANTTLSINYDNDLGFAAGEQIFMEFVSANNISLKTDSSGRPLVTHEGHQLKEIGIITENLVYDNNHDHILDNLLNAVYVNQF